MTTIRASALAFAIGLAIIVAGSAIGPHVTAALASLDRPS